MIHRRNGRGRWRWVPVAILLAIGATPALHAQDAVSVAPRATETPAADSPRLHGLPGTRWYGYYQDGTKIGWIASTWTLDEDPETGHPKRAVLETRAEVNLAAVGDRVTVRILDRRVYEAVAPWRLLRVTSQRTQGEEGLDLEAIRGEEGMEVIERRVDEEPRHGTAPSTRETLLDVQRDRLLVLARAEAGTVVTAPTFDLEERREFEDRIKVLSREKRLRDGVEAEITVVQVRQGKSGQTWTLEMDDHGEMISADMSGRLRFVAESEEEARRIGFGRDQFRAAMIQPDRPLGYPVNVRRLVLRLTGIDDVDIPDDGRQVSKRQEDGSLLMEIRAVADGAWLPAAEADVAAALRPTTMYPSDHPEMIEAAKEACGDATTPREKAERLTEWVSRHVQDVYTLRDMTALDTLRAGRGDCSEHTTLYVALARAAGLPTRRVGGVMYGGPEYGFSGHAWPEVALDGKWVPFDPTWDQIVLDATHIRLSVENEYDVSLDIRGRVKIEVVEVERNGR